MAAIRPAYTGTGASGTVVCAVVNATTALTNLSLSQRDQAFTRVDELLAEFSRYSDKNAKQNTEVMAGVLQVLSKMDSLI